MVARSSPGTGLSNCGPDAARRGAVIVPRSSPRTGLSNCNSTCVSPFAPPEPNGRHRKASPRLGLCGDCLEDGGGWPMAAAHLRCGVCAVIERRRAGGLQRGSYVAMTTPLDVTTLSVSSKSTPGPR